MIWFRTGRLIGVRRDRQVSGETDRSGRSIEPPPSLKPPGGTV